jgi:hypothetical protein
VDQSGGDTCHHYKGDMWHTHTNDVEGMLTWFVADVANMCGRASQIVC